MSRRATVHPRWCHPPQCSATAEGNGSHGSRYFYVDDRTTVQLVKPASLGRPTVHLSLWAPAVTPGLTSEPTEAITFSMERAALLVNTVADMIERAKGDQS